MFNENNDYVEKLQLEFQNQMGSKQKINFPIFFKDVETDYLVEQMKEIIEMGLLLDHRAYDRHLTKFTAARHITILRTTVFMND
ncbi:hypothetical protein I6N95_08180 [Vagococcus sp. BWB3-3]|uniref:Uncharacterized protein n=1 Tax=Vagococcus allomyrinae TaxID=2794353 RepID=A0A940SRL9_9ENTE|nr:hypothetical protein [Vagococcus allomyrinae]MBP1040977.1 hypothetical protein [Vagococcus allomyrinae]